MTKRILALLMVLALLVSGMMLPAYAAEACFEDVPADSWYYPSVKGAYEQGLMVGRSDTAFCPQETLTRAMFVTVLGRIAEVDTSLYTAPSTFSDVEGGRYFSPYIAWAQEKGIAQGIGDGLFGPEWPVTREQMATFIYRYLKADELTLPDSPDAVASYADAASISPFAAEAVEALRPSGLFRGSQYGDLIPGSYATRAEAATVFLRLNQGLKGDDIPKVNTWIDYTGPDIMPEPEPRPEPEPMPEPEPDPIPELPVVANPIVSNDAIFAAAETYGLDYNSNAFAALVSINTAYVSRLTASQKAGTLVFMFEGAGNDSSPTLRMNALCVVVKSGRIVYVNGNSSTLPDFPFDPSKNQGTAMPTLRSGIYGFGTLNHYSSIDHITYAALTVNGANVVRFTNQYSYYNSTSDGINIHRRKTDTLNPSLINSAGCLVVGKAGADATDEYARFIQAVGIVPAGYRGDVQYRTYVSGTAVIDRSFARSYLANIGYPVGAITALG